jgi:hypothetical protein
MSFAAKRLCLGLTILLAMPLASFGQLTLSVDSIDASAFPTVRLMTVTRDAGLLQKSLSSTNYTVTENGFPQTPVSYFGTRGTRPFSIILLLAVGSYVSSSDLTAEKGVASAVIDSLDGLNDESELVIYNDQMGVPQAWTPAKQPMRDALAGISSGTGGNRFWDGVSAALLEAAGTSNIRTILVISNGRDDGSVSTLSSVVTRAKTLNLKIFTVGINAAGGENNLQNVAQQTGGTYFTNPSLAVETVVNLMRQTPPYCILEYTSNNRCRDGAARNINVQVSLNSRNATANGQYPLTQDPASNVTATFKVDTVSIPAGRTGSVGVLLQTTVTGQLLQPGSLDLAFDKTKLTLTGVTIDTTLVKNTTVAAPVSTASGATISWSGVSPLNGKGRFLNVRFMAADVTQNTDVPVTISGMTFSGGCIQPQTAAGRVLILPKNYGISGRSLQVISYLWNDTKKDYDPSPAEVKVEIQNTGDLPLTGVHAVFPADSGLRFAWGSTSDAPASPSTLQPGEKGIASWFVKALPRPDEKGYQFDVAAAAKEPVSVNIRVFMNVKPASSGLAMSCSADTVKINGGAHTPKPAMVRAYVRSAGTAASPAGQVTLVLPQDITLASGTTSQAIASMASGGGQLYTWPVNYPTNLSSQTVYPLTIVLAPTGAPADTCTLQFVVPGLTAPSIVASCLNVPAFVAYDTVTKAYADIVISGRIHNYGAGASDSVKAVLTIPPELTLAAGQTATKLVSPSIAPNDSADVSWTLRASVVACTDRKVTISATLRHANTDVLTCSKDITLLARPNLLPEVRSFTPAKLDTLNLSATQAFSVQAIDANGDPLNITWWSQGHVIGGNTPSASDQFIQTGKQTVRCVIRDGCGADSVVVQWTFDVVNKTGLDDAGAAAHDFTINAIHPNPLTTGRTAVVECVLPTGSHSITLDVIDGKGAIVSRLFEGQVAGGAQTRAVRFGALPPGAYFLRLSSGAQSAVKSFVVSK